MQKIKVNDQGLVDCLEAYHYEVAARQQLLAFMVNAGYSVTGETFTQYHKEYVECIGQYEMAKKRLENEFVAPQVAGSKDYRWDLDFETGTVTISGGGV